MNLSTPILVNENKTNSTMNVMVWNKMSPRHVENDVIV